MADNLKSLQRKPKWARILVPVTFLILVPLASPLFFDALLLYLGGNPTHAPSELHKVLSPRAKGLLEETLKDLPQKGWLDYHTHVVGLGTGDTGAFVNSRSRSLWHPLRFFRFHLFRTAAGVRNLENADSEFMARLVDLVRHSPKHPKHVLLPFDAHYNQAGEKIDEKTDFYVPNEYVFRQVEKYPDLFLPAISVHPYRKDALDALRRWASRGGMIVKWLPNSMGIDPSDPKCDPFYDLMKELELVLISHAGEERAVESSNAQELGNPLRLRRALDKGVRVIVAHCAGLGTSQDLDHPQRLQTDNFDLFLRLVEDERYRGLVYGDISALILFNRCGRPLRTLLERKDLHRALVYGSDYPLPAVDILVQTGKLVSEGYLRPWEAEALEEIYGVNPILFDYVLKKRLRAPETQDGFSTEIFTRRFW